MKKGYVLVIVTILLIISALFLVSKFYVKVGYSQNGEESGVVEVDVRDVNSEKPYDSSRDLDSEKPYDSSRDS